MQSISVVWCGLPREVAVISIISIFENGTSSPVLPLNDPVRARSRLSLSFHPFVSWFFISFSTTHSKYLKERSTFRKTYFPSQRKGTSDGNVEYLYLHCPTGNALLHPTPDTIKMTQYSRKDMNMCFPASYCLLIILLRMFNNTRAYPRSVESSRQYTAIDENTQPDRYEKRNCEA